MSKHSTEERLGWYGVQEIPVFLRQDCECVVCDGRFPKRGRLWTDASLRQPAAQDARAYSDWAEKIRLNTYCTFHALSRFASEEDGQ